MTYPDRELNDVNAHLEALFLITDASAGSITRIKDRLQIVSAQDNAASVMLYLASYAAVLLRRLREHQALPGKPDDFVHDIAALVAATVPRPE